MIGRVICERCGRVKRWWNMVWIGRWYCSDCADQIQKEETT